MKGDGLRRPNRRGSYSLCHLYDAGLKYFQGLADIRRVNLLQCGPAPKPGILSLRELPRGDDAPITHLVIGQPAFKVVPDLPVAHRSQGWQVTGQRLPQSQPPNFRDKTPINQLL